MKNQLIQVIQEAGRRIANFYGDKDFTLKEDLSPITKADQASHNYLIDALPQIKNIPILSEENIIDYEIRNKWSEFWLIDPLDGTQGFINGQDDFCINIALIQNNRPTLGLIFAPILNEFYWGKEGQGFEYRGLDQKREKDARIIVARSRFNHSALTKEFMEINQLMKTCFIGAAIKFGRLAIGQVDLYPRFEGSKEWDTAAGQIILKESGCSIVDLKTQREPSYNKKNIANDFFIAYGPCLKLKTFKFPDF
jgi:3'(2'), 5'-bisphosphate nucleotidase